MGQFCDKIFSGEPLFLSQNCPIGISTPKITKGHIQIVHVHLYIRSDQLRYPCLPYNQYLIKIVYCNKQFFLQLFIRVNNNGDINRIIPWQNNATVAILISLLDFERQKSI